MLPIKVDAYKWKVYTSLLKYGAISPKKLPHDGINPSLLVTGNLTNKQGLQLLGQFLSCTAYRNWLQAYGCVRMLFWLRAVDAQRVMLSLHDKKMNRLSTLARLFSEIKPIACVHNTDSKGDVVPVPDLWSTRSSQPIDISSEDTYLKSDLVLLDIQPRAKESWEDEVNILELEYVIRNLFILPTAPLSTSITTLGSGAEYYFAEKLPQLMDKITAKLTNEEFVLVFKTFNKWPFKPDHLFDVGNDVDANTPSMITEFS